MRGYHVAKCNQLQLFLKHQPVLLRCLRGQARHPIKWIQMEENVTTESLKTKLKANVSYSIARGDVLMVRI